MEITGEPPPLWPQLATTMTRRHRRSPFPLFTPPVLIILLPTIALLLLFFAVPPFLSTITTQISKPTGVKKGSDSLTIYLLFFAILCGIFAIRNDGDGENDNSGNDSNHNKLSHPVSPRWFDQYPEKKIYDDHPPMNTAAPAAEAAEATTSLRRLRRNSSSYPDLRQASLWENSEDQFRFPDDFEINRYRSSTTNYHNQVHELRRSWTRQQFEETEPNVIPPSVSQAPSTPPPPPPSPPPVAVYRKPIRSYHSVGQKEKVINQEHYDDNFHRSESPQPVTPPQPPPPPPRRPASPLVQTGNKTEQRFAKLERRKSNAAKEIKVVFASLRKRTKKKKAKDHNHDHHEHDCPLHSPLEPPHYYSTNIPPPSPPPPPPPLPPPPSSVFQKYNLFKSKANKSKKIHSVPPPPPPFSVSNSQNRQIPPTTPPPAPPTPPPGPLRRRSTAKAKSRRPPLPTKANTSYCDENVNSGGQSPLIPNPPPPPPFKTPEFKFVFREDFVNIRSGPSSRCSSPDIEEVNAPSSIDGEKVSMMNGDDGIIGVPVICPSPDVNAKAETFIARFRDGWKLEKINSMKEKQKQS